MERSKTQSGRHSVYILRTSGDTLYTGQTNNIERRLGEHLSRGKRSAKYLRRFKEVEIAYLEEVETLEMALKREAEIKRMTKRKKEEIIKQAGEISKLKGNV